MNLYDTLFSGAWVEQGGGGGGGAVSVTVDAVVASYGMSPEDFSEVIPNVFMSMYDFHFPVQSNVIVSIDGTEYECELGGNGADEPYYYGGKPTFGGSPEESSVDFSVYPFSLILQGNWAYLVPEVPSTLTVVDVIAKDTYDSIQPERTTIETGTAVEDKDGDPGTYVALLPNVSDASELADCYITIGGKTYKIIDDQGSIYFAMGGFSTKGIATGLSAYVGGDFEIFKYRFDGDLSWNDISYNSGSSNLNGANVYVQTSGTVIDDNGVATQSLVSVGMMAVPIKTAVDDIIVVKAEKNGLATGVQWSGSITATNCTATLLAKTDKAATIYRFIKVTNVSGDASIQNVATAYTT